MSDLTESRHGRWSAAGSRTVPRLGRLAKNMRRLRAERGLSQEALAHECGINRTYLSGVERGRDDPP
jgi:DNA-binding XRE family transcriptional regulator